MSKRSSLVKGWLLGERLHSLEHLPHLLVNGIDGLERPDHHFELDDLAVVVARNDVDTID